jgi:hypothetical protein
VAEHTVIAVYLANRTSRLCSREKHKALYKDNSHIANFGGEGKVQTLAVVLTLINILVVLGPIAGVLILYRNNLTEIVVPQEAKSVMANLTSSENSLVMPQLVGSSYDVATRTVTVTFNFTNPLDVDLKINELAADVECAAHGYTLGHAGISGPVQIRSGETANITVVFTWTQQAETHFMEAHAGAASIDIDLVNLVADVSGITVQTPEHVSIPNVPLPQ